MEQDDLLASSNRPTRCGEETLRLAELLDQHGNDTGVRLID